MSSLSTNTFQCEAASSQEVQSKSLNVACTHCALPVPRGLVNPSSELQFCCNGCAAAYDLIHAANLDRFYTLRSDAPNHSKASTSSRFSPELFDHSTFTSLHCTRCSTDQCRAFLNVKLIVENVHCSACVWLLERLPRIQPGVIESRLDFVRSCLAVSFDPQQVKLSEIARTLDRLGYRPHALTNTASGSGNLMYTAQSRGSLIRVGVAGACAGNIMLLYLALYAGAFEGMEPGHIMLFRWAAMIISVISLVWPGAVFFKGLYRSIINRTLHMDVPIAMGLGLGGLWGIYNTMTGTGETYFDSISALTFFLLIGRHIQMQQQRSAANALSLLFSLTPTHAHLVSPNDANSVDPVPVESLATGSVIRVYSGETIAADGLIVAGNTTIDRALLTGESLPVAATIHDAVHAGTTNVASTIDVAVSATGQSTRVGKLMSLVESGLQSKAPVIHAADRLAAHFLIAIIALAIITLAAWWPIAGARVAFENTIALLVVTCPCGLGLATPLVMTIALGRAAKQGVLIKSASAIQSLAASNAIICLDKTGTLTKGQLSMVSYVGDSDLKPLIASVCSHSNHPVSKLLTTLATTHTPLDLIAVKESLGKGLIARVGHSTELIVGSASFVCSHAHFTIPALKRACDLALESGASPVLVAKNGIVAAVIGVADTLKTHAPEMITALRTRHITPVVLSGDHPSVVQAVATTLGISPAYSFGGQSPADKLAQVETLMTTHPNRPVFMVGDGVNDAPALAKATVGIAMHGGAEASLNAADVYLTKPDLPLLVQTIDNCRTALNTVRLTIITSVSYNIIAAALCMTGQISALLAAIIMPASSLTVLALALRSKAFARTALKPSDQSSRITSLRSANNSFGSTT